MKKIVLSGGTGFIGSEICAQLLQKDYELVLITRYPSKYEAVKANNLRYISWDNPLNEVIDEADAVIHLAGEPVIGGRWTEEVKKKIHDSRIQSTRKLVQVMSSSNNKPEVFISASASGYYGDTGIEWRSEDDSPGEDFLAKVCIAWEKEAQAAKELGIRVVNPRIGIVLGQDGGALKNMLTPFRLGLGGSIGPGTQFMSWIHLRDLTRAIIQFLEDDRIQGPVNMCAPEPVTMDVFTQVLAKTMHRPNLFTVPSFALKLLFGEGAQPILDSIRMKSEVLEAIGFTYTYEDLEEALFDLV
jgi:uncharacterized protein (TIGR01777 family)